MHRFDAGYDQNNLVATFERTGAEPKGDNSCPKTELQVKLIVSKSQAVSVLFSLATPGVSHPVGAANFKVSGKLARVREEG